MSWKWRQSTGEMFSPDGVKVCEGIAGNGEGLNNPAMDNVSYTGPLPKGKYTIKKPSYTHKRLGPVVMNLIPFKTNEMFGRSAFRIHGLSKVDPKKSSKGCVCVFIAYRQMIENSEDDILEVVA